MSDEQQPIEDAAEPKRRGRPRKIKELTEREPSIGLTFEQMKELLAIGQQATSRSPELEAAIKGLEVAAAQTTKLATEVERTTRRSNAHGQDVSVFNFKPSCDHCQHGTPHPETGLIGHPKPALTYDTYWPKGCKVFKEDCTVLEIELFNSFTASRTARDGTWTATLKRKSTGGGTLVVDAPSFHMDDRASLPPLPQLLMELLHGPEQADPMLLIDRMLAMEQKIKELEAAQTVPA